MLRMLIGSALVTLCAALAYGQACNPAGVTAGAPGSQALQTQSLQVTGGPRIDAVFDVNAKGFKVDLKNGTYKLDNGGAIRVRGGVVVWDAFGVVEKIKSQGKTEVNPCLG